VDWGWSVGIFPENLEILAHGIAWDFETIPV
jgi:hypothetical protein